MDFRKPTPEEGYQIGLAVFTAMAAAAGGALVNWFFAEAQRKLEAKSQPKKDQ